MAAMPYNLEQERFLAITSLTAKATATGTRSRMVSPKENIEEAYHHIRFTSDKEGFTGKVINDGK